MMSLSSAEQVDGRIVKVGLSERLGQKDRSFCRPVLRIGLFRQLEKRLAPGLAVRLRPELP